MTRNVRDRFCGQDGMFDVMDILKSHEQNARFSLRVDIMLTEAVRLVPRTDVVKISLCSLTDDRSQAHAAYSAYTTTSEIPRLDMLASSITALHAHAVASTLRRSMANMGEASLMYTTLSHCILLAKTTLSIQ